MVAITNLRLLHENVREPHLVKFSSCSSFDQVNGVGREDLQKTTVIRIHIGSVVTKISTVPALAVFFVVFDAKRREPQSLPK